ncbi:hypothetical protein [Roseomonas chloroacetimidivorans]|uniref:hypothetical protein n=1 Tax=Roseomonas chloroacetimidivorans TaxID=1766656 RepID=UPI003C792C0F
MADLTDVLTALAQGLAGALYPNGTAQPSAVGAPCVVFPGWPDSASLDADLAAGKVQVSVFPRPGMARIEGRRLDGWVPDPVPAPLMTATAGDTTVTFAGAGLAGQIAAVMEGGRAWTAPATGTPEDTAAALAAMIQADRPCTVSGTVLTLPGAVNLRARVVGPGSESITLRRQIQPMQVTVWAPTPVLRSAVGQAVDLWIGRTPWLGLPADERARLLYTGLAESDDGRQALLHRRDLFLTVDYPTIDRRTAPVTAVGEVFQGPMDPPGAPATEHRFI